MEHLVIKLLGFDVAVPTSNVFAEMYCRQLGVSESLKCMTQVRLDVVLLVFTAALQIYEYLVLSVVNIVDNVSWVNTPL